MHTSIDRQTDKVAHALCEWQKPGCGHKRVHTLFAPSLTQRSLKVYYMAARDTRHSKLSSKVKFSSCLATKQEFKWVDVVMVGVAVGG